jgi:D-alanyl-lipoteichoic acid acyltransferase DltB (MBOAT superfamily)
LSTWLRDYIYISLGGGRKGNLRKHVNLILTFIVSGIWHGTGLRFIAWGGLTAFYQIAGDFTYNYREKIYERLGFAPDSVWKKRIKQVSLFFLNALTWIIFRADSFTIGLKMLLSLFVGFNPWILFGDSLFALGLDWKEMLILLLGVVLFFLVSVQQEKGECLSEKLMKLPLPIRWFVYIGAILFVLVFGSYGFGFNAQDFIYGGF